MGRTLYIVNPRGAGGSGGLAWDAFRAGWPGGIDDADIVVAENASAIREAAESADGCETVVAAGGDGTVSFAISGIMDRSEGDRPRLAVVPCGTGNDFARNIGITSVEDASAALQTGVTRRIDLFSMDFQQGCERQHRYGVLGSNVGFAAVSFKLIKPWMKRLLGPKCAYYLSVVLGTAIHRPPHVKVKWDGGEYEGRVWMIVVGNVERTAGGSWCIAPGARIDDGKIHVTIMPAMFRGQVLARMPEIGDGSHVKDPNIQYFAASRLEVESLQPSELVVDGDVHGATPVTYQACASALEVVAPSGQGGGE